MRTKIIFALILISFGAKSQNYTLLLENNKKWNVLEVNYSTCNCVEYKTNSYYLGNDTLVDTVVYKKLMDTLYLEGLYNSIYSVTLLYGLIREDTLSHRVYFKQTDLYPAPPEYLLYDFDLDTGDYFHYGDFDSLLVDTVDSVFISYKYFKRIKLRKNLSERLTWIEGIGALEGLVYSMPEFLFLNKELLCYWQNDTLVYTKGDPIYNCLYADFISDVPEMGESIYNIYPNPVTNYLYIESESVMLDITINDINRRVLFNDKKKSGDARLDMSMLNPGFYILTINNQRYKILKK